MQGGSAVAGQMTGRQRNWLRLRLRLARIPRWSSLETFHAPSRETVDALAATAGASPFRIHYTPLFQAMMGWRLARDQRSAERAMSPGSRGSPGAPSSANVISLSRRQHGPELPFDKGPRTLSQLTVLAVGNLQYPSRYVL